MDSDLVFKNTFGDEVRLSYEGDLLHISLYRLDPEGFRPPQAIRVRGSEANEFIAWVKERMRP